MVVIVFVCDRCSQEALPNASKGLLKRLGWRLREKHQDPRVPDLCPTCNQR